MLRLMELSEFVLDSTIDLHDMLVDLPESQFKNIPKTDDLLLALWLKVLELSQKDCWNTTVAFAGDFDRSV